MKDFLYFLFHPSWWRMNYPYSRQWDEKLNAALDSGSFYDYTTYTIKIKELTLWVGNFPYACFCPYRHNIRPSRKTIRRAYNKLIKEAI